MRLGFACAWDPEPRLTWSQTPWNLREALARRTDVVDVGFEVAPAPRVAMKALHARRHRNRIVSTYKHSSLWSALAARMLRDGVRASGVDAVLEIQDLAILDVPFFVYQDASYDVLLELWERDGIPVPHFETLNEATIRARRERQLAVYQRAAGVFAMSEWFAGRLSALSGIPREKIHVVPPGVNALPRRPPRLRGGARHRLLLLGRDFHTKAGDLVVEAFGRARRDYDPQLTLTIAGPERWPLAGSPPAGVEFLGKVSADRAGELLDSHDLLVMPSRFEGFGIVFAEALSRGLPCIGRNAFAMPEMIRPGHNGELLDRDDPEELATLIARVLTDDSIYVNAYREASGQRELWTWDRAAGQMLTAIDATLGASRLRSA